MQAVLKGLYSSDVADLENYQPEEEDNFGLVISASIGLLGQTGGDSFEVTVCTPKWLLERHGASEILLGLHKLIVFRYDYSRIRRFIEKFLMRCSGVQVIAGQK